MCKLTRPIKLIMILISFFFFGGSHGIYLPLYPPYVSMSRDWMWILCGFLMWNMLRPRIGAEETEAPCRSQPDLRTETQETSALWLNCKWLTGEIGHLHLIKQWGAITPVDESLPFPVSCFSCSVSHYQLDIPSSAVIIEQEQPWLGGNGWLI